jgi:phosphoglucosamine mutase
MTAEVALNIGRAVAHLFKKEKHRTKIIIGKDTRISGYMLEEAIVSGICSMGADAYIMGPLPTPGVSFMALSQRADAGIVISASHNPYHDNGIKIFSGDGFKLPDEREKEIENFFFNDHEEHLPDPENLGKAYRIEDAEGRYIVFLKNTFPRDVSMEGMKIVLDCANGATYKVAPHVFWELGADIHTIHNEPNGLNINDECGSQYTKDLSKNVLKGKAAIGMAFDGDGDRIIVVDEKGNTLTGDQIVAICANTLKKENRLKNNTVVTTIMSNKGLSNFFKSMGIKHLRADVGDRYVLEEMLKTGSAIGGEDSGHIIFLDHHTSGDGIVSGLQLVATMLKENKPLSELAKMVTIYPQVLINVKVKTKPEISKIPEIVEIIEKTEKELGDNGRVLVRYSGTEQICRIMVEGPDEETTKTYCKNISKVVKKLLN